MPNIAEAVNSVVSLILGVGLFILIIRISTLLDKLGKMLEADHKKDNE